MPAVGSAQAKAAAEGGVNLEDISDDDSDPYDDGGDSSEEEASEEVDGEFESEEEVEDDTMPKTTPSKKRTPIKRASTPDDENVLSSKMNRMSMNKPVKEFSMEWKLPFIMNTFNEGIDQMVKIDVFVPALPEEYFIPDVGSGGRTFELKVQMPSFFIHEERVIKKNSQVEGFNQNTHEAQSFKDVCERIDTHFGMTDKIFGDKPFTVDLPFVVEERIVEWEVQAYVNEDIEDKFEDESQTQYHFVLQAKMKKLATKRRTAGKFRVIS